MAQEEKQTEKSLLETIASLGSESEILENTEETEGIHAVKYGTASKSGERSAASTCERTSGARWPKSIWVSRWSIFGGAR